MSARRRVGRRIKPPEWPSLEPIRNTRIYEEIVRQIRALVADGKLKSGDRLPPERELTERFRVSRTSVREALRALEGTGLAQDAAFYTAIAHSSHNRAITRIVTALMDLLAQSREESLLTPGRPQRSHDDHRKVLGAIAAGDASGAERAMLAHLVAVERLVTGREAPTPGSRGRRPRR